MKNASSPSPAIPHEEKERLAYRLWEQANRPSGQSLDFWLQAETQLAARLQPQRSTNAKVKAPGNHKSTALARPANQRKGKRALTAR
jgi:Protein of unknown function (DUF2934)